MAEQQDRLEMMYSTTCQMVTVGLCLLRIRGGCEMQDCEGD